MGEPGDYLNQVILSFSPWLKQNLFLERSGSPVIADSDIHKTQTEHQQCMALPSSE